MKKIICIILCLLPSCVSVQNNIKIDSAVDYDQNGRITKQEMKQYIVEIEKEKSNLNKEIKVMIEQMEECESYLIYEHR